MFRNYSHKESLEQESRLWMELFYVSKETILCVLRETVRISSASRFRTGAETSANLLELNSLGFHCKSGIFFLDGSFIFLLS